MCACSFDMMFTFVYMGWEGTANDSRVFMDALNRPESGFPLLEEGKNIDIYIYMCVCVCVCVCVVICLAFIF